uniref:Uncharacterized protein n=1 Tax=Ascaris lumbricoides TaxID=6252 RepID=A0A0M3I8K0_ASCLU
MTSKFNVGNPLKYASRTLPTTTSYAHSHCAAGTVNDDRTGAFWLIVTQIADDDVASARPLQHQSTKTHIRIKSIV